ncbi:Uncharacterized protein BCRIVMBC845_02767 [Bacillus cereus]|nr:Uncharacterized protein BCINRASA_02943 [Bacillus wiedmannii]SCV20258.1 Uncharacterized protein BCRIVMBC845_02767 [Bacillus cereus]
MYLSVEEKLEHKFKNVSVFEDW